MTNVETMKLAGPQSSELRSVLSANQEAIESFCWAFQQWLTREISSRDAFASELLLREALANAVEHGCSGLPNAQIQCVVRGGKGRILIAVHDPGPGFDWSRRMNSEPAVDTVSGRGVSIYRTYASRLRFNDAGNAIFIHLRLVGAKAHRENN